MIKHFKHALVFVLLLLSSLSLVANNPYGLKTNIQDGVILHCFNWKYSDIKAMLPQIAEAGFTSVQTSPAQPAGGTGTWWWLYQPLSFYIGTNELGGKEDLRALCTEAENYGIKVIVDVVANHLAGNHSNIQDDLKDSQYWHTHGAVSSWNDRYQVTHGEIGMPDINSEHSYVQQCVARYIEELKSVGVDGIRWDAAKHISLPSENCGFWPAVTQQGLWHYGEILEGPVDNGGDALMKEYTNYMSVTDNAYGRQVIGAFSGGSTPSTSGNWSFRGCADDKLVYWAESHDTYSNDDKQTTYIDQNKVDRAYAIVAAQNGATSLYFSRPFATDKNSIKIGVKGSTNFTKKEVAEVNRFHNALAGQKSYYAQSGGVASVCRQGGAVIVKGNGSGQVTATNGGGYTQPGTYTDKVSGNTFTVTATTISGTVGESGIAVLYNGENTTPTPEPEPEPEPGEVYTPTITTGEVSVFYEAPAGVTSVAIWAWNTTANFTGGVWASKPDMELKGKSANGNNIFKWTYTGSESGMPESVIFIPAGGAQTDDLEYVNNGYYVQGVYNRTITAGGGDTPTPEPEPQPEPQPGDKVIKIYVKTAATGCNIYAWNNSTTYTAAWPGDALTETTVLDDGSTWYVKSFTASAINVIFNCNGKQTGNITGLTADAYFEYDGNTTATNVTAFHQEQDPSLIPQECVFVDGRNFAYFEAPSTWSDVYVWAWNAGGNLTEAGTYPGDKIEQVGVASNGNIIYQWIGAELGAGDPSHIIFNAGNGQTKTADLSFTNGGYYTLSGLSFIIRSIVTGIEPAPVVSEPEWLNVFTIDGRMVRQGVKASEATTGLPKGIYIVNRKKVVVW